MPQVLFKNARLLDPYADALAGGMSVLVEGETIREVSPKPIKAPKADVIDCKGLTLMPGSPAGGGVPAPAHHRARASWPR